MSLKHLRGRVIATRALQATGLIIVGILVGWLIGEYADWSATRDLPPARWLQAIPFTILVFGIVLSEFRSVWKLPLLWMIVLGLLAVHVVAHIILLSMVTQWRLAWYVPLTIVETPILITMVSRWVDAD